MFFSSERERVKAENPEASFGELGKILGARWKEMDDEAREPYVAKAAEMARYEREKKAAEARAPSRPRERTIASICR